MTDLKDRKFYIDVHSVLVYQLIVAELLEFVDEHGNIIKMLGHIPPQPNFYRIKETNIYLRPNDNAPLQPLESLPR
jgi:hypothetical protein